MRRRAPRPLSAALDDLTARLAPATLLGEVQRVWEAAAGAQLAGEATPVSERAGTITLQCSSAQWMAEIDLLGPTLVAQLNARIAGDRVSAVRVTMAGRRGPRAGR